MRQVELDVAVKVEAREMVNGQWVVRGYDTTAAMVLDSGDTVVTIAKRMVQVKFLDVLVSLFQHIAVNFKL